MRCPQFHHTCFGQVTDTFMKCDFRICLVDLIRLITEV